MRIVFARCSVDYIGRLTAHLPEADRLLICKADGSVLIHSDGGSYKPLNWMSPPCTLVVTRPGEAADELSPDGPLPEEPLSEEPLSDELLSEEPLPHGPPVVERWTVTHRRSGDRLEIAVHAVHEELERDLGIDPGLVKDGVEAHLQALLAEHITTLGDGYSLVRREFPTAIGPVDILARNADGATVAVEIKRRGEIDGVEQLTRYLALLNRDPHLAPVQGVFAAQRIKPQARVLAEDRGITCVTLDYDALRGIDDAESRLF